MVSAAAKRTHHLCRNFLTRRGSPSRSTQTISAIRSWEARAIPCGGSSTRRAAHLRSSTQWWAIETSIASSIYTVLTSMRRRGRASVTKGCCSVSGNAVSARTEPSGVPAGSEWLAAVQTDALVHECSSKKARPKPSWLVEIELENPIVRFNRPVRHRRLAEIEDLNVRPNRGCFTICGGGTPNLMSGPAFHSSPGIAAN